MKELEVLARSGFKRRRKRQGKGDVCRELLRPAKKLVRRSFIVGHFRRWVSQSIMADGYFPNWHSAQDERDVDLHFGISLRTILQPDQTSDSGDGRQGGGDEVSR